jgi:dihydroxyacid dehydratase/phosphogluconate dehydratase
MEGGIARSPGFCTTMGSAATMNALAEVLGLTLPGASSIPAVDSGHVRMALNSGERIVKMIWEDFRPKDLLTMKAFDNRRHGDWWLHQCSHSSDCFGWAVWF